VVASVGSLGGPCEFTCWPEGIDDEVLHVGSSVPWAGQDKPYVAMRKYLDWPKRSDNAMLHMRCYESSCCAKMTRLAWSNSLGGPKQVVCCHARMSWLAQRNSWGDQNKSYGAEIWMNEQALFWVNSLIPRPSGWTNSLGKNPLCRDKNWDNG
jgi:hypothetical protein